ncbi:MAG: ComF family protein [Desulfobacterales bacterium]
MILKTAARIGRSLSDAVFPLTCAACGKLAGPGATGFENRTEIPAGLLSENVFQRVMRPHLCFDCLDDFTALDPPLCTKCGEPFKSRTSGAHLCGDCITRKKHFSCARAFAVYDGAILKLIHAYKYKGRTRLAKPLAELVYAGFNLHFSTRGIDTFLAVPLHKKRLRSRGFNQAHLILRHMLEILKNEGLTADAKITFDSDSLVRTRDTATQTGLERGRRIKNIKNAFELRDPEKIAGKNVLLVDDVFTTGSTCEECARVIDEGGAASVCVLTLARAV